MNNYLEKIKKIAMKQINRIKARRLKKKILESDIKASDGLEIDDQLIDSDIVEILLEDKSVIDKLNKDKTLLYYVSMLKEDEQLSFLNRNIDIFSEDRENMYAMALKNISFEKLLKTELGSKIVDEFPRECYERVRTLGEDKLKELSNQSGNSISSYDIANKIFEMNQGRVEDFLNEKISTEDKIAVLKDKRVYMPNILRASIDDKEKIEIISNLGTSTHIDEWIELNLNDEVKSFLVSRTTDSEYREYIDGIFPTEIRNLSPYRVMEINRMNSVFGKERIDSYLDSEQRQINSLAIELGKNFDEEEIKLLFDNSKLTEMNFSEKNADNEISNANFAINSLIEIKDKDGELFSFRKYYEFRDGNNDLDYKESIYKSLYEYKRHGDLYKDIINNFQQLSDEEKAEFKDRWNELMNLDNKFGIQNIQDFKNMDEIEKNYYSKILENSNSNLEIKQAIAEILVRDGDIDKITKLGNGTDYSMDNKPLEDIIDMISTINEINDQEALKGILSDCIGMIGSDDLKRIRMIGSNIEEKIVQEYREGYTNSLTDYASMSDEELAKIEGISVQRINGVRVIELKGADFAFLSHTGGIEGGNRCCSSQITNENYETFKDGLDRYTYIYSDVNPRRIKTVNVSDAGLSKYRDTYISADDLSSMTQRARDGWENYNEVTLSTRKEKGDDELRPSAIMTRNKVNSDGFIQVLNEVASDESKPKTVFVIHEDIYEKKREREAQEKESRLQAYLQSLDPKLLNMVLLHSGGSKEEMSKIMEEIKMNIRAHMDEKVGKGKLRRNISRYWQLSRGKGKETYALPNEIMGELQEELAQMDNSILAREGIVSRVKEVPDDNER